MKQIILAVTLLTLTGAAHAGMEHAAPGGLGHWIAVACVLGGIWFVLYALSRMERATELERYVKVMDRIEAEGGPLRGEALTQYVADLQERMAPEDTTPSYLGDGFRVSMRVKH